MPRCSFVKPTRSSRNRSLGPPGRLNVAPYWRAAFDDEDQTRWQTPQCCFGHCSPLVVGGERSSVSPQVIKAADAAVAIPMLGMANSLNVATGSVTFYDLGCPGGGHANSSSNSFASFRSRVSNPSVNSRDRSEKITSLIALALIAPEPAMLIAALSSQDFAVAAAPA